MYDISNYLTRISAVNILFTFELSPEVLIVVSGMQI
jgi:hypothetical protein